MTDLAVIILNYNTIDLLRKCLQSVLSKKWKQKIEIWVVDNASKDGSGKMVQNEFPQIKFIQSDKNLGFSGGNNLALKKAEAEFYLLLNSDTEVTEDSFDTLIDVMKKKHFDVASCKLVNLDNSIQPNAGDLPFGLPLLAWLFGLDDLPFFKNKIPSFHRTSSSFYIGEKKVGWLSGSVLAINKKVLESVGLLDDKIFMYSEDVDYCIRASRAGFSIGWTDKAVVMHVSGASSADPHLRQWTGEFRGLLYLYKKYYGTFASMLLKAFIYFAILLRIIGFYFIGKSNYAKTYSKILVHI
jgi:GT2 family glycosyltransferase